MYNISARHLCVFDSVADPKRIYSIVLNPSSIFCTRNWRNDDDSLPYSLFTPRFTSQVSWLWFSMGLCRTCRQEERGAMTVRHLFQIWSDGHPVFSVPSSTIPQHITTKLNFIKCVPCLSAIKSERFNMRRCFQKRVHARALPSARAFFFISHLDASKARHQVQDFQPH